MLKALLLPVVAMLAAIGIVSAHAASGASVTIQVVDQRGVPVRDAVVELDPPGGWSGPIRFPWRMAMAQRNEQFVPGTLVVARGSTVAFPNLDRVRHSIYSFSKAARFSIDLYGRDQTRTQRFPVSGAVALGCNIHDDMRGYIRIVDTPWAGKTDQNGLVRLDGVPGGSFGLTVWHPRARTPGGELKETLAVSGSRATRKIALKLR